MRSRVILAFTAATWTCLAAGGSAVADYTFTNIADESGAFFDFFAPSINDAGQVAFAASLDEGQVTGVYRSDGGSLTTIAESGTVFQRGFDLQTPGIDADGRVAFVADRRGEAGGGKGIFIGDGNSITIFALTPTTTSPQPGDFAGFLPPRMNSAGALAFIAPFVGTPEEGIRGGVFLGTGLIVDDRGPFQSFGDAFFGRGLDINNQNVVVFKAVLDDNNSGIYVHGPGGLSTVADTLSGFAGFNFSVPAINDAGKIVFWAEPAPFVGAIYTASAGGGEPEVFVDGSGPYGDFGRASSINASGTIVFTAGLDPAPTGNGIFTGPDAAGDKVIFAGDPLFGSVFGTAFISNACINDAGQIAFRYELANGRRGIAVATPIPVCAWADFNGSGSVDGDDLALLAACRTGPAVPYDAGNLPGACSLVPDQGGVIAADADRDGDVDQDDFGAFQRCYRRQASTP